MTAAPLTTPSSTAGAVPAAPQKSAVSWAMDLLVWGVLPDAVTWGGAGIIIASGLYLLRRERVHVEAEHP